MSRLSLLLIPLLLVTSCTRKGHYSTSELRIALSFVSKEMCSCLFVAERTDADCREWVKIRQLSPKLEVDFKAKRTRTSHFLIFSQEAVYRPGLGCTLL